MIIIIAIFIVEKEYRKISEDFMIVVLKPGTSDEAAFLFALKSSVLFGFPCFFCLLQTRSHIKVWNFWSENASIFVYLQLSFQLGIGEPILSNQREGEHLCTRCVVLLFLIFPILPACLDFLILHCVCFICSCSVPNFVLLLFFKCSFWSISRTQFHSVQKICENFC